MKQEHERSLTCLSKGASMIWDCGSSLYDSFEVASLSHIIERRMMALPSSSSSTSARSSSSTCSSSSSSAAARSSSSTCPSSSSCASSKSNFISRLEDASFEANDDGEKCNLKGMMWKRKVDWEGVSDKKATKRVKISGYFRRLNCKLWRKYA